jgi:hypothetical protein
MIHSFVMIQSFVNYDFFSFGFREQRQCNTLCRGIVDPAIEVQKRVVLTLPTKMH